MQPIDLPDDLPDASQWTGATALPSFALLAAQGPDAGAFLHGQLSQDMAGLPLNEARLAAYCSAKGRMLASFLALRPSEQCYWLLVDRSIAAPALKRLSMFVLRSQVKLADAGPDWAVAGLIGSGCAALADAPVGAVVDDAATQGKLVKLASVAGCARALWIGPAQALPAVLNQGPALSQAHWEWLDALSGVARIQAPTVEQFVPQMINFELVGGVNFSKGCYPGQEVVARSQYRGTLKRRAFLAYTSEAMQAGQEIFSENDPSQPAGMVVQAAQAPGGGPSAGLIELKLAEREHRLHVGAADGALLTLGTLPYDLPLADA